MRRALRSALLVVLLPACGGDAPDSAEPTRVVRPVLDPSAAGGFFDTGYPTDLRQDGDGRLDLSDFPRLDHAPTERYVRVTREDVRGFPPVGAIYVRFDGPLDAADLPGDPAAYASADAPIQLVDVDPGSPERGRRFPLEPSFATRADSYRPANLLQVLPSLGISLAERRSYALLLTDRLPVPDGARAAPARGLARLLEHPAYAPLAEWLREDDTLRDELVGALVFTTGAPSERLRGIAAALAEGPRPRLDAAPTRTAGFDAYCVLESSWTVPVLQQGAVPYLTEAQGGAIRTDPSGAPLPAGTRRSSVVLTIPKRAMPAAGFPLLRYHHGTGGLASQVYTRGPDPGDGERIVGKGPAEVAAERGWAAASYGGHLAQEHYDGPLALDGRVTYNFLHPRAMRDNYVQLGAEAVLFRRLVEGLAIDPAACPEAKASAAPDGRIRFDPSLSVMMGQSQGSITAGLAAAADPLGADGLILSGAGASWIESPFDVTDPIDLAALTGALLGLPAEEPLDRWHPMLTLAEHAMGPGDNVHLLPRVLGAVEPRRRVPHVLVIEGYVDPQVPSGMQRALVAALGLDLVGPDRPTPSRGELLPRIRLAGGRALEPPVAGNREVAGAGPRTAVVLHYLEDGIRDGHNVAFQLEEPKHVYGCFLEDLARGRVPTIVEGVAQGAPCR